ncbi:kinase [Thraustotheca clavata]|uniref:Kinase n=1 Tax=Thraustotheca clavata TaxID=74557 RepID=A0A1W0A0C9_9STRA|nr:kinase [Thraustotheca clavata]
MGNCIKTAPLPVIPEKPNVPPTEPATESIKESLLSPDPLALLVDSVHLEAAEIPANQLHVGDRLDAVAISPWDSIHDGTYNGAQVLIKKMDRNGADQDTIDRLVYTMKMLLSTRHPNVIQFFGASWNTDNQMLVVTEKLRNGDLASLLASDQVLSLATRVGILLDIVRAMAYLHSQCPKIVHRDLKGANIHISCDYRAKVANLENSCAYDTELMVSVVGTPVWVAPEIMRGEMYNEKVDIYSFAMVEVLNREIPYAEVPRDQKRQLLGRIAFEGHRPTILACEEWPIELIQIIEACWHSIPSYRPSFIQIMDMLESLLRTINNPPHVVKGKWKVEEDEQLFKLSISLHVPHRSNVQCRQRWENSLAPDVVKGKWPKSDDDKLMALMMQTQNVDWKIIAKQFPGRNNAQCRARWERHLNPEIKKNIPLSTEERDMLEREVAKRGNQWAEIARDMPDELLKLQANKYGNKNWIEIATHFDNRTNTQCHQRWNKTLAPGLVKGKWKEHEDKFDMVIECPSRGNLKSILGHESLNIKYSIQILLDVARAIKYIHSIGIIHCHIQASNVYMMENMHAKVGNFELACAIADHNKKAVGSVSHSPPEILKAMRNYNEKVDMYSFAMCTFIFLLKSYVLNGRMPYTEHGQKLTKDILNKIADQNLRPTILNLEKWPFNLISLLQVCWDKDSDVRPTASEIQELTKTGVPPWERISIGVYNHTPVIIKQLFRSNLDTRAVQSFSRVIRLLIDLHHPNIVQLMGASWDSNETLCMVTESLARGNLAALLDSTQELTHATPRGMAYLHGQNPRVLHRDLKGANIHITEEINDPMSLLGSPAWTAPEILRGESTYTGNVDVYSFSMVMVEIMNRKQPYKEVPRPQKRLSLVKKIAHEGLRPTILSEESWPKELVQLVKTCWSHEPTERPTFKEIIVVLQRILQTLP